MVVDWLSSLLLASVPFSTIVFGVVVVVVMLLALSIKIQVSQLNNQIRVGVARLKLKILFHYIRRNNN